MAGPRPPAAHSDSNGVGGPASPLGSRQVSCDGTPGSVAGLHKGRGVCSRLELLLALRSLACIPVPNATRWPRSETTRVS